MTKITIELDLLTTERISAVIAIARLLEFDEAHGDLALDEYGFLHDHYFWIRSLPNALAFIMEALERKISFGADPEILEQFFDRSEGRWKNAIGWLRQGAQELDELNPYGQSDEATP